MIDINYVGQGIYKENILDHYKSPRNYGYLTESTINFQDYNPFCGDKIDVYLKIENDVIKAIKFQGHGCAISIASFSMTSELIQDKKVEDILQLNKQQIFDMLGINLSPIRIKCALLGLIAVKKALCKYKHLEFNDE